MKEPIIRPNLEKQPTIEDELLRVIADQVRFSPLSVVIAMTAVAYLMSQHLPDQAWLWISWLLGVILTQGYRIYRLPKLPLQAERSAKSRIREAAAINTIGIFIQSLSLLAFPLFTPFEASLQTMAFIAMGVGSISTAVGWAPYALSHIFIALLPTFALWAWSGFYGPAGTPGILIALAGVPYAFTLWLISKRLYRMYQELFWNRARLAVALEDAEIASASKTRFLAAASHDLRQPIHTLSLFSAALGLQRLDERTRKIADSMEIAVAALSEELDALLDISKLDAGVVSAHPAVVSLDGLLSRLAEEFRIAAESSGITLRVDCPKNADAYTDSLLLERIVRNVITNSITHNTDCSVAIEVSAGDNCWELRLSDDGQGIPHAEHRRIFEEFYQIGNPERARGRGLGLGLSIVKRLATLLELDMTFHSTPGEGTSFGFSLPADIGPVVVAPVPIAPPIIPRGIQVLVVDDEESVREAMQALLELQGCEVLLAQSTAMALAMTAERQPDIALVDFRLAGLDSGVHTINTLRERYPALPVILISGDTGPDRLSEAAAAGITLLSKPVAKDVLCTAIANACSPRLPQS